MSFNPANFALQYTNTPTGQQVFSYDGGADTDGDVKGQGYFPNTLGLQVGDVILAQCSHGGVSGKTLSLEVNSLDTIHSPARIATTMFYKEGF